MKILINTFFLLLFSFSVWGQNNITLYGTLFDKKDDSPVIACSVELLRKSDSAFVAGTISHNDGSFSLKNLSIGEYILRTSYIGYRPLVKNINLKVEQTSVYMGSLYLETDDILLQEAVIEIKKPEVIVKNDTIEYDASSYKTGENTVVEDLLKKLPGVEVDKEGKITINGKEVKRFLVDDKEFFSDDPQVASKSLPAEMVEKLQVLERKSDQARLTGFDDGEEETVINLSTRPGMKKGTIGNILFGGGKNIIQNDSDDIRYQGGIFINHMKNNDRYTIILGRNNNNNMGAADLGANQFSEMRMRRINGTGGIAESTNTMISLNKEFSSVLSLNSDIRYNGSDRHTISQTEEKTSSKSQSQLDKSEINNHYISDNASVNFRLEYKPDTANTLIFRPNIRYNISNSDEDETDTTFSYVVDDTIIKMYSLNTYDEGKGYRLGGTLDYAHKFHKSGRVFSMNLRGQYNNSNSSENDSIWQEMGDSISNQRFENDNYSDNYRIAVSWVEPLGKNNFLQALYRFSHNNTKSINSTYNLDSLQQAWLVDSLSRSTVRHFTEHRMGLSFKSIRNKYNYTVGFHIDPSYIVNETWQPSKNEEAFPYTENSYLPNSIGDICIDTIQKCIINFSPLINFNYIFGPRTNLRIDYEGETYQPSANQLRDYTDKSHPTNWIKGNPALKHGYTNTLNIRFSKYVAKTQLMYNIDFRGGFTVDDIISVTRLQKDGIRLTTYENVNGNWNSRLRGMFNIPLKNKKFSIGGFTAINYINQNSYEDNSLNTMRNFTTTNNTHVNYRSDLFDIGLNIFINHNIITYTVQSADNPQPINVGIRGNTTWYLPHYFTLESDISYTQRKGYSNDISETIWNAALSKQLLKNRFGVGSLKLQVYDILHERNSISFQTTANGFRTVNMDVIPRYFICSFAYKFTVFPYNSHATEDDLRKWNHPTRNFDNKKHF